MLLKYSDFILESLLLESNVIYSDKFRRVLEKIPTDPVSKKLMEIENKDLEVIFNYIDVKSDNENVLSFTSDKIAQEILKSDKQVVNYVGGAGKLTNNLELNKEIFGQLGYVPKAKETYDPTPVEVGEVISKFKSLKTGKVWCYVKFENGEGVFNEEKLKDAKDQLGKLVFAKNRQEIRIGRLVRGLLSANKITGISDSEIEKFVNDFRATLKVMNDVFSNFEIVEGDQLGFWYHRKNYIDPHKGSLGSSCQAPGRLDWLEIYIKNPETVKLVILHSDVKYDKISGRALLWKLDDGTHLMDVIYVSKDSDHKIFSDYAKHNGWHDANTNYTDTFTAHVKPITFDKYPSVDTMCNWNPETGQISNRTFPGSRHIQWSEDDDDYDDYLEDDDY